MKHQYQNHKQEEQEENPIIDTIGILFVLFVAIIAGILAYSTTDDPFYKTRVKKTYQNSLSQRESLHKEHKNKF